MEKEKGRAVVIDHEVQIELKSELNLGRFSVTVTGLTIGDRNARAVNALSASIAAILGWAKQSSDALKDKTSLQILDALAEDTGVPVNELLSLDGPLNKCHEPKTEEARERDFSRVPITAQSGKVLN